MKATDAKIRQALDKLLEGIAPTDVNPEMRGAAMREVERILQEDNCILELAFVQRCVRHMPAGTQPDFIESLRVAFFTGANAVFTRMATSAEDLPRINRMAEELEGFFDDLSERNAINMVTVGSA